MTSPASTSIPGSTLNGPLRAGLVEDRAAFEALEAAWTQLDAHPNVRPFQSFAWVAAWVKTLGQSEHCRLRIATLWQDSRTGQGSGPGQGSELVGVMPLCVRRYKGLRLLEWLGARVSDYCDVLLHPRIDARQGLDLLWRTVNTGGFDIARLSHVRVDAQVFPFLESLAPWTETHEDAGGVDILWNDAAGWMKQLSAGMRDRIKYNARRMKKAGFDVEVCEDSSTHAAIIDTLVEQKRPWLAARGLSSMVNETVGVEFLQAAVAATARRGELHLSVVRNADVIAACDLAFVRSGVIYSYMASFDPAYAKYSFGRVLTDSLFAWACDAGQRRLDLLLGAYDYKTEYNCTLEPVRTLALSRGLIGRAALALYRRRAAQAKG